ncbi:MAG: class I SAM-dependent methyltransferase [Candidatus Omnitrophica bacterium]|nr:class I SAM-dependent methyltransferase [Candidatus Omnitrophota bacterium]
MVNQRILSEQKVWGLSGNERFFTETRSSIDHLYRSEKFFLPQQIVESQDFLDIGCACGDFSRIVRHYNPAIRYTGADIIERFINIARERYPEDVFIVSDGISLAFPDNRFDLVHSSGILHLNSQYKDVVREMYRVSSRHVLCDFRLTNGPQVIGEMDVNLVGQEKAVDTLPYYVVNVDEHLAFLKSLSPSPARITVKGYAHPPTKAARLSVDSVLMAFFLIEKGNAAVMNGTVIDINLNA